MQVLLLLLAGGVRLCGRDNAQGWKRDRVASGRSRRSEWHRVDAEWKSYADDSSAALRGALLTEKWAFWMDGSERRQHSRTPVTECCGEGWTGEAVTRMRLTREGRVVKVMWVFGASG